MNAPTIPSLTLGELIRDCADDLGSSWLIGEADAARIQIGGPVAAMADGKHHAAAEFVGHLNLVHPSRLQIAGREEAAYLAKLPVNRRSHYIAELMLGSPPAVILGDSTPPDPLLEAQCSQNGVALLTSPKPAAEIIDILRIYLARALAERTSLHGVFMDVLGMGVLITGDSGVGKSELGLELISRGHGLVADDVVDVSHTGPKTLEGRCPAMLKNLLEVRGLGLLDIRAIFGETAVRPKMNLKLIVHLAKPNITEAPEYERLPLNAVTQMVLGVTVSKVVIPVAAGRNLAVLLEAAVRNTILKLRGFDPMAEFAARQALAMRDGE